MRGGSNADSDVKVVAVNRSDELSAKASSQTLNLFDDEHVVQFYI